MKQINLRNKINTYVKNDWHPNIVVAYKKYIETKDSVQKEIVENHFKNKEVICEESLFYKYLEKTR
jgi:hypothetical protein